MKHVLATTLILALLVPILTYAAPGDYPNAAPFVSTEEGGSQFVGNPDQAQQVGFDQIQSLTSSGDVVGCQTGGFGGALAQTFGAALQQAIPGLIRGQLQGLVGNLASKAGPFGNVVSTIGNIAINKLSSYVQQQLGQVFGNLSGALGGTLGGVLGGVAGGTGLGAGAVPVNTVTINTPVGNIDAQTKATQNATETSAQKDCVGDVIARKLANAALSLLFKSTIDFVNNGFNGNTAIIQNLRGFFATGIEAVTRDFLENRLAGLCTTGQRATAQTLILTQYQYETNFGKRFQCNTTATNNAIAFESGDSTSEALYNTLWDNSLKWDQYLELKSQLITEQTSQQHTDELTYLANQGLKNKIICSLTGQPPADGSQVCSSKEGVAQTVFTGSWTNHLVETQLDVPTNSLLNADEIGEIIDALTASVTQVALQGVDGLLGLSKQNGNQGSYLDSLAYGTANTAQNGAQTVVAADIQSAITVEESYRDTVTVVLDPLIATRAKYLQVVECYKAKSTSFGIDQGLALTRMQNASTTVATVLTPQIVNLTNAKGAAQSAIEKLSTLRTQAQSALTQAQILSVNQQFTALAQTGQVHSATDLLLLQNNLQTTANAVGILAVDASAQLAECQAL